MALSAGEARAAAAQASDAGVIACSCEDGEAFAVIFDRHAAAIHRYLARRGGAQLADDLTGQTFLAAFDQRRRFDPGQPSALPWLYGIATRLLRRHRRNEARQYRAFARTGVDPAEGNHADVVAARVTAQAAARRLAGVLARLPAAQRDVLLLAAWQHLSYEEISQALGIPAGTVGSRLHRARTAVRAAFGGIDPTTDPEENSHG
jgi:RNA polymerase sigma factor (sigma-70 family)